MDTFEALRASYLTEGLSDDEVRLVASVSTVQTYADMEDVIREFEAAGDVFIMIDGKARVTTSSGEPISRIKALAIVGEIALFGEESRTASVVSDGPSRFVRLDGAKLNALMDANPAIGIKVLRNVGKTLCEHLRSSNIQLESVLRTL
jgi:CRP-like cAMP-binding protein